MDLLLLLPQLVLLLCMLWFLNVWVKMCRCVWWGCKKPCCCTASLSLYLLHHCKRASHFLLASDNKSGKLTSNHRKDSWTLKMFWLKTLFVVFHCLKKRWSHCLVWVGNDPSLYRTILLNRVMTFLWADNWNSYSVRLAAANFRASLSKTSTWKRNRSL